MKRTADSLFGDAYTFSILAAGRHQMRLGTMGAIMGGNVRVGLEDSIYLGKGQLAKIQRRAGHAHPQHPRGPVARDRDAGRGARAAAAQGRRSGRVLSGALAGNGTGISFELERTSQRSRWYISAFLCPELGV